MNFFARTALLALLALLAFPAFSAPILPGTWYVGSFSGTVGSPVNGGPTAGGGLAPGAPPWTFTLGSAGGIFSVVDCCAVGDRFEVFNSAVSLGITSLGSVGGCNTAATCDALVGVGRGDFVLGAGTHSITMTVFAALPGTGNLFFRVTENPKDPSGIPEPGSILLGVGGLGALALLRHRRFSA